MSGRIFQGIVMQMKEAADRTIGVIDSNGYVVACSDPVRVGEKWEAVSTEILLRNEAVVCSEGFTFKPLTSWTSYFDFAAFVQGEDSIAKSFCVMSAVAFNSAKSFYDEKHDRATFIKNILLDNILPGDIYVRSRELHFESVLPRAVMLVRQLGEPDNTVVDVVQSLFPDRQRDFVISINEIDLVLVRELTGEVTCEDLRKLAQAIEETIKSELMVRTVIGIGTVSSQLKDLASSYKEAQVSINVGKVFDIEKSIVNYENLGIGRLIYQLPTTLCEMFLSEVFKNNSIDLLDRETLDTIHRFFENSLNVSETSRKLFVHRNTLVYRLEKIKKITGLDLREFDHAIIFKVALMVKKYLASRETIY